MYRFTPLEHTADKGVAVEADSLGELFAGAAAGMYASILPLEGLPAEIERTFTLNAGDREALLVAWLQELLFVTEVENLFFFDFRIEEISDTGLRGQATGCPWPHERARSGAMVKAVTYYGLSIRGEGHSWRASVVFDV